MDYIIETRDLTKCFGAFEAVSALNLHVAASQITGFLGRNVSFRQACMTPDKVC